MHHINCCCSQESATQKWTRQALIMSWFNHDCYIQGWANNWSPRLQEFFVQVGAEVVSNSRKQIHQTWRPLLTHPCTLQYTAQFGETLWEWLKSKYAQRLGLSVLCRCRSSQVLRGCSKHVQNFGTFLFETRNLGTAVSVFHSSA